jgi:hypothetical protein
LADDRGPTEPVTKITRNPSLTVGIEHGTAEHLNIEWRGFASGRTRCFKPATASATSQQSNNPKLK